MMQTKDLEVFLKILNEPVPFGDFYPNADEDACRLLLNEFSETEIEELACVSYAFWIVHSKANDRLPSDARRTSALKDIRRHYVAEGRNHKKALLSIREALAYRREYRFDLLRSCFYDSDFGGEDPENGKKYARLVLSDLARQPMFVCGTDDHDRPIIYKPPRKSSDKGNAEAEKAFLLTQIYTAERAMAITEFATMGKQEEVTVIIEFNNYNKKNAPGPSVTITMIKVLQRCYPERLGTLIISNPSFWVQTAINVVRVFLSKSIAEKIRVPTDKEAVDKELQGFLSGNENLKGLLTSGDIVSFDLTDYTEQPFYSKFQ